MFICGASVFTFAISAGDTDLTGVDVPEEVAGGLGEGFEMAGLDADGEELKVDVAGTSVGGLIIGFGWEVSIPTSDRDWCMPLLCCSCEDGCAF